jgi:hypothetical protein
MRKRVTWRLAGLAAALFLIVGVSRAGIQIRDDVCWLGTEGWQHTGGWQLRERDGEPCLVEGEGYIRSGWRHRLFARDRLKPAPHRWYVSAPTIKAESGKFLAYGRKGREPKVYLAEDKGHHTRWLFEIVKELRPRETKGVDKYKQGPEGFTFRVIAAEGEFKNWYLAAEDPPKEEKERNDREPATRRLKLVRNKGMSTDFEYVSTYYEHQ